MYQSDYINKKKMIIQIQNQNESPPILDSSIYTKSRSYSVLVDISNSLITHSQLFQEPKLNANCRKFITCFDTNNRPNRILNNNSELYSSIKKYVKHPKQTGCKNSICKELN